MSPNHLIKIGYFTDAVDVGGADVVLRQYINNIDHNKFEVILFCQSTYKITKIFKTPYPFKIVFTDIISHTIPEKYPQTPQETKQPSKKQSIQTKAKNKKEVNPFIKDVMRLIWFFKEAKRLEKIIRKENLDIFHNNDVGREAGIFAARLAKVPIRIGTYHTYPNYIQSGPDKSWAGEWLTKLTNKSLTKATIPSKNAKNAWLQRLNTSKNNFQVIHNGVKTQNYDISINKSDIQEKYNIRQNTKVILALARLHPMKGLKFLIQAMPQIHKNHPNIKLLIAGDGEEEQKLKQLTEDLKMSNIIDFLGWVANTKELIEICDLSVLASIPDQGTECFPMVLLESMAMAKPVVATTFSGIPEIVDNQRTGLLVPYKDSKALANAIDTLLTNTKQATKMGQEGQQRLKENFTEEKVVNELYELYQELLTQNNK